MIKAVIFDFDGVICQSESYRMNRLFLYYKSLGIHLTIQQVYSLAGGSKGEKETILDSIFGTQRRYWEVKKQMLEYKVGEIPLLTLKTKGIEEVMTWLCEHNIKIGIASNSKRKTLVESCESLQLLSYIDCLESAFDFQRMKPDPFIYKYVMSKLEVQPDECIIVEDSKRGIEAASKANAFVVALKDKDNGNDQTQAKVRINSMVELIQVIKNIKE